VEHADERELFFERYILFDRSKLQTVNEVLV